ncbi:MAG: DUF4890 domain-containing protein [Bacteroidales bacterium]|nr:DUF4890 domain-containing protein [Bacteroidales bacterium]
MKRFFLILVAAIFAFSSAMAQDTTSTKGQNPPQQQRQAPKRLTPQERATMQADRLKEELELTEEQYKKVYKAILGREKETDNMRAAFRPGGMGGGGMRGGGAPRVARVSTGMNSNEEQMKSFRERCDKKIKKALSEEQYAKYQEIEAKRLKQQQEMMERMRNRNRQGGQRPGGQRPAGQRPAQQN